MSHGHSHGGGSCCHGDDPEEPPERRGQAWGLYLRIDRERLECLNERREGSGKLVFRAWEDRGDRQQVGGIVRSANACLVENAAAAAFFSRAASGSRFCSLT